MGEVKRRTLDIVEDTEVLSALLNGDNIHESSRVAWLSADLAVDLDESLCGDGLNFTSGQGVLETISQQDDKRERFADLVRTGSRSGSICAGKLVQHP